jgi:uncharacterized protein
MGLVSEFPRKVVEIENVFIELSDHTRLAARIWLPADADAHPVPAILEYLPYRKRDGTIERDALTHPYFAGHGYACVRVDMRGSGDSDGVLRGEYLEQEQDDALEVLAWLAQQPWCTGKVGMIGISWGGFNGLQIAARRPPELAAVISICSTDDRYADDIHFMGGCLLLDKLSWGSTMFSLNTAPPDPALVGERWRELWMERLERSGFWVEEWLRHQRRDAFYRHGSICEDWSAVRCPVYAVGGWADGYSNAVFRLLANLTGPKKGLIGPWAHKYPHFAKPGPKIGFLQECLRWWDHWLKAVDTGIMREPMFRVWMEDSAPPRQHYEERAGRWIAEESWPSPNIRPRSFPLLAGRLGEEGEPGEAASVSLRSPQDTGSAAGKWCPYGLFPDQSGDQRLEQGGQLVFDSPPLQSDLDIFGFPSLLLSIASDQPWGLLAATLCEVLPDGAVTRVTYGLLNLTHRNGHDRPEALVPGTRYPIDVVLNGIAHRFAKGNRLRVALSTAYWPLVWPSPRVVELAIDLRNASLSLPVRPPRKADQELSPFSPPDHAAPVSQTIVEPARNSWRVVRDAFTGETVTERLADEGVRIVDHIGLEVGAWRESRYSIKPSDPLTARADISSRRRYRRGSWQVSSATSLTMTATETHFLLNATLDAYEDDRRVFTRSWSCEIERDHV